MSKTKTLTFEEFCKIHPLSKEDLDKFGGFYNHIKEICRQLNYLPESERFGVKAALVCYIFALDPDRIDMDLLFRVLERLECFNQIPKEADSAAIWLCIDGACKLSTMEEGKEKDLAKMLSVLTIIDAGDCILDPHDKDTETYFTNMVAAMDAFKNTKKEEN